MAQSFQALQRAGIDFTFTFAFNAKDENRIVLKRDGQIQYIVTMNTPQAGVPFEAHRTDHDVLWEISADCKFSFNNIYVPSDGKELPSQHEREVRWGFDDFSGQDKDYDDAICILNY